MESERRAAGLDTFLNPATASYEPLQTQAPQVAQPQAQGGSIWSPPRPAPAAPPAPDQPPQQPAQQQQMQPTGDVSGQQPRPSPVGDQLMAQWQNQNAHPPAPASEVLKFAKANFDTRAQDVTYLPHGGPPLKPGVGGKPAYGIHMKGGGMNIVPVSQLVQNGFAPNIAGNNTSLTLSGADRAGKQGQDTQPPPKMQPTENVGAQKIPQPAKSKMQPPPQMQPPGAPPPAPTTGGAQFAGGTQPAIQMQPTGAVGGQVPGQPPPPAAPGGLSEVRATDAAGNVNPALMAGGSDEQALAASRAADDAKAINAATQDVKTSPDAVAKMEADDPNATHPTYHWKPDENGKQYTALPDPNHPFYEQRYYKGSLIGFQSGPWNAENLRKQQLLDEYGGPSGVPIPPGVTINYDAIKGSTPEQQDLWLKHARNYRLHPDAPLSTSDEGKGLINAANAVRDAQRIRDKILWMKQNNIPMSAISQSELIRSQEAGWAGGANNPVEGALWKVASHAGPKNDFADELRGDYNNLNDHLAHTPGGYYEKTAATPQPEEWGTPQLGPVPPLGFPKTTNLSTIPTLNSMGQGDNYDQPVTHIQEVLAHDKADYKNNAEKLGPGKNRMPDLDLKNLSDLADPKKGYIDDPTNKMWDKNHQTMVNGYGPVVYRDNPWLDNVFTKWTSVGGKSEANASPTPSATPAPPQISKYDTKEFDRLGIKKGDKYLGPDGKTTYTRGQ